MTVGEWSHESQWTDGNTCNCWSFLPGVAQTLAARRRFFTLRGGSQIGHTLLPRLMSVKRVGPVAGRPVSGRTSQGAAPAGLVEASCHQKILQMFIKLIKLFGPQVSRDWRQPAAAQAPQEQSRRQGKWSMLSSGPPGGQWSLPVDWTIATVSQKESRQTARQTDRQIDR